MASEGPIAHHERLQRMLFALIETKVPSSAEQALGAEPLAARDGAQRRVKAENMVT